MSDHPTQAPETLEAAVRAFLAKWPAVKERISGVFSLQQMRSGVQYDGPTIGAEVDAMAQALRTAEAGDTARWQAIRTLVKQWRERSAMFETFEHQDPSTAVAGAHHAAASECQRCADELDALLRAQEGGR